MKMKNYKSFLKQYPFQVLRNEYIFKVSPNKNIVVNLQISVVCLYFYDVRQKKACTKGVHAFQVHKPFCYEFIEDIMNSLNSFEIGIRLLLIIISLELMASIWSTFTIYDL